MRIKAGGEALVFMESAIDNHKHWCGIHDILLPERPPVLVFQNFIE